MLVKKFIAFCFLFILSFATSYAAEGECENCAQINSYVYVIDAASGTLEQDKEASTNQDDSAASAAEKSVGQYTLTLHRVEPQIDWLKGRPFRRAGSIQVVDFVKAWDVGNDSFAEVPPNALLVSKSFIPLGVFGGSEVYAFILSNPRYDPSEKTLIFDAQQLPGINKPVKEGIYRNLSMYIAN